MLDTGNSRSQTGLTLLSSLLALAVPALFLGAAAEAAAAGAVDEEAAPAGVPLWLERMCMHMIASSA